MKLLAVPVNGLPATVGQPSADSICKSAATPSSRYKESMMVQRETECGDGNANTTLFS